MAITQNFVPEADAIVASSFVFNGSTFEPGTEAAPKPFPHRELKVDKSTLNGLWLAGLVRFVVGSELGSRRVSDEHLEQLGHRVMNEEKYENRASALAELIAIAKGIPYTPPPIVYKEDPEDEPDPAVLKAQMEAVKATVKPPKPGKPKAEKSSEPAKEAAKPEPAIVETPAAPAEPPTSTETIVKPTE